MAQDKITHPAGLLVIGGSAGSLEVILQVLPAISTTLNFAILIVVHRKPTSDTLLVDLLSTKINMPVKEAEEKEFIYPNRVYVAPADYHLLIEKDNSFSLDVSEKVNYSRPGIDVTFESAADVYGKSLVALLLSGANADGVAGLKKVKEKGGLCIVQDPSSAEVDYMPRQAIQELQVDKILTPSEMAGYINQLR